MTHTYQLLTTESKHDPNLVDFHTRLSSWHHPDSLGNTTFDHSECVNTILTFCTVFFDTMWYFPIDCLRNYCHSPPRAATVNVPRRRWNYSSSDTNPNPNPISEHRCSVTLLSLDLDRRLYLNLPMFQIVVVYATRERRSVDREIDGSITHSISESKWSLIIEKIATC